MKRGTLWLLASAGLGVAVAMADVDPTRIDPQQRGLACKVNGSDDYFLLYPWQLIYQSPDHLLYALMGGRTLALVQRQTLRFNRLTSLNIQPEPQPLQLFDGHCSPQQPVSP